MGRRRSRYTVRADGRHVRTETINGVRKFFYGRSDDECDKKYNEYVNGVKKKKASLTFKTVAAEWWAIQEPKISPNSLGGYRTAMRRAVDHFGSQKPDEITGRDVLQYLNEFAAQGYSQKVINNHKSVLKKILDYSLSAGDIERNPCVGLPLVSGEPRKPRKSAPKEDVEKIEQFKAESLASRMIYFMLWTGARRGEAACIQQKDIDYSTRTISVNKAIAYGDSRKPLLKKPKSDAGIRYLNLYDNVLEILPHYDDPETYIFFPDGLPTKTKLETSLRKFQDDHGLTSTAHQLRHSHASKLHTYGIDVKDAQSLLGHSSIEMTEDIYTELEEAKKSEVFDVVNERILVEISGRK